MHRATAILLVAAWLVGGCGSSRPGGTCYGPGDRCFDNDAYVCDGPEGGNRMGRLVGALLGDGNWELMDACSERGRFCVEAYEDGRRRARCVAALPLQWLYGLLSAGLLATCYLVLVGIERRRLVRMADVTLAAGPSRYMGLPPMPLVILLAAAALAICTAFWPRLGFWLLHPRGILLLLRPWLLAIAASMAIWAQWLVWSTAADLRGNLKLLDRHGVTSFSAVDDAFRLATRRLFAGIKVTSVAVLFAQPSLPFLVFAVALGFGLRKET